MRIPLLYAIAHPSTIRALGFVIGLMLGIAVAIPFLVSLDAASPDWGVPLVIVPLAGLLGWFAAEPAARRGWLSGVLATAMLIPSSMLIAAVGVVLRSEVAPRSDPGASVGLDLFRDTITSVPAWITISLIVVVWVIAFRGAVRILGLAPAH